MVATFFTAFYINLDCSTTKSGAKTLQKFKKADRKQICIISGDESVTGAFFQTTAA